MRRIICRTGPIRKRRWPPRSTGIPPERVADGPRRKKLTNDDRSRRRFCGSLLVVFAVLAFASLAVLREYERGVVFRMGHVRPLYRPGLVFLIPLVDKMVKVDQRVVTLTIPPQQVITRDNVPARVNAVVMFQVTDPPKAILAVENYAMATSQIAQTTLRSLLGRADLDTFVAHRDDLNRDLQTIIEEQTQLWGIEARVGGSKSRTWRFRSPCSARWRVRPKPSANAARRSSTRAVNCRHRQAALVKPPKRSRRTRHRYSCAYLTNVVGARRGSRLTVVFPLPVDGAHRTVLEAPGHARSRAFTSDR